MTSNDIGGDSVTGVRSLCAKAEERLAQVLEGIKGEVTGEAIAPALDQARDRARALRDGGPAAGTAQAGARWDTAVAHLIATPAPTDRLERLVSFAIARQVVSGLEATLDVLPDASGSGAGAGAGAAADADRADTADGPDQVAIRLVRDAVSDDERLVGRLSLHGRRSFGRVLLGGAEIRRALETDASASGTSHAAAVEAYFAESGDAFAALMSDMGLNG